MKKALPIIIILLVLGTGAYYLNSKKQLQLPQTQKQKGEGMVGSIQDALSKSLSLKCEYPDEEGNKTTTYIKAGAIRADAYASVNGQRRNTHMIMKDEKLYTWDDEKKEGMMMSLKSVQNTQVQPQTGTQNTQSKEDVVGDLEKYKDYCKSATVSDSLFTPPSDIKFTDLEKEMKKSGIDMKQIQKQAEEAAKENVNEENTNE